MMLKKKTKMKTSPPVSSHTAATERMVATALSNLNRIVVLATIPSSDKTRKPYKISLGTNNAIWCDCPGFQNRNKCRHMERFRTEFKTVVFGA